MTRSEGTGFTDRLKRATGRLSPGGHAPGMTAGGPWEACSSRGREQQRSPMHRQWTSTPTPALRWGVVLILEIMALDRGGMASAAPHHRQHLSACPVPERAAAGPCSIHLVTGSERQRRQSLRRKGKEGGFS